MARSLAAALIVLLAFHWAVGAACAEAVIRVFEEETKVIMTGEGSLNVEDLFLIGSEPFNGGGYVQGSFFVGDLTPSPFGARFYGGSIERPSAIYWTPNVEHIEADFEQDSGAMLGLLRDGYPGVNQERVLDQLQPCRRNQELHCVPVAIVVPGDYVTGEQFQSRIVIPDTSIEGLGLESGEYVYSWGSGLSADTLTIRIVPEPCLGFGTFALSVLCMLANRPSRAR